MGKEKNLNNSQLNTDTENVKPNLHEIFHNPKLIWELYKNLSLSDTYALNSLEKLSHYITVKKLYESIPNIDKFASSKKTLKSCFNWDLYEMFFLYMALFPSMFSSFKELYMGKTSWQDWRNRLNDEDLQELDSITTIPNDLSNKQIISEIRNAINHTHYVPGEYELFIKNPKNPDPKIHARDFEANVPYEFLIDFITLTQKYYRRSDCFEYYVDEQKLLDNLWENKKNIIRYEDVKDKIHFFHSVTKDKYWDDNSENLVNAEVRKEVIRSEQLENLILKYFSNHKLNKRNLRYVSEFLIKPPEIHMWEIFQSIINNELKSTNKYKWLNSTELINSIYEQLVNWSYYWFSEWFNSIEEVELITNLWKELQTIYQPNWQPMLKHYGWCLEYAGKYLKKHGFSLHKEWNTISFKKWNIKIEESSLLNGVYMLCDHYHVISNVVKLFPNWLRLQLIKLVYVNEQVSLQDENVEWLISKIDATEDEQWNGKKTIRERIRDALSHHSYIILEGVDDIVLRDGYKKRTDSRDREATFSLSELFESTFKEINENDIVPNYASLIEELNSSDN